MHEVQTEKHQRRLAEAYTHLHAVATDSSTFLSDQSRIGYLELFIKAHLSFTNLLPLSTVGQSARSVRRAEAMRRNAAAKEHARTDAAS